MQPNQTYPQSWDSSVYEQYVQRRRDLLSENMNARYQVARNEAEIQLIEGALATLAKYAPEGYPTS